MRIYLVAVSLLLTLFTLFLLWPRTRSFFRMSLITGGMAVLLTFIPGIRAHDFGIRSQVFLDYPPDCFKVYLVVIMDQNVP